MVREASVQRRGVEGNQIYHYGYISLQKICVVPQLQSKEVVSLLKVSYIINSFLSFFLKEQGENEATSYKLPDGSIIQVRNLMCWYLTPSPTLALSSPPPGWEVTL